ncbi:hypothetical protein PMAYCL1PPCAC_22882 [Pristionchus mayeri]|uniref:Uncharacterized protein n=1 Tax=Pristionchus mayeri TaxID=1317129 RepID=A0AAN5CZ53_9BILA|nr:hypothetical protein PMAYCL1PPCAC_22882 [Pristionchus mayeri]
MKRFSIRFGYNSRENLKLERKEEEMDFGELIGITDRLFDRVYTTCVEMYDIDFNIGFADFAIQLLDRCLYENLCLILNEIEFNEKAIEFLRRLGRNRCKKTNLNLNNILIDEAVLLSLFPLKRLIININPDHWHYFSKSPFVSEETFVELVRRGHAYVNIPVIVAAENTLEEIKKIIEDSLWKQTIVFEVTRDAVEKFLIALGFNVERGEKNRLRVFKEIARNGKDGSHKEVHLMKRRNEGTSWSGDFSLQFEKSTISAKQNLYEHPWTYTFEIRNCAIVDENHNK